MNEIVHETVLIGAGKIALDELARRRLGLIRDLFAQFCRAILASCSPRKMASS